MSKFDYSEFTKIVKNFDNINLDWMCYTSTNLLAKRLQERVKKFSPVGKYPIGSKRVGGALRKSWNITPIKKNIKSGSISYDTYVYSNVSYKGKYYAYWVEKGHRLCRPAGHQYGYVQGRFMLTKASTTVMNRSTNADLKRNIRAAIEDLFVR